jgi:maleylpyruvate isomerase
MRSELPNFDETVVATARYLEALTELSDEDVRAPSLLPGWSRGHVITHLARNADALANVLSGPSAGETRPMYESNDTRDADIEAGAGRSAAELRDDSLAATDRWRRAAEQLHAEHLEAPGCRTPGGRTWPVRRVGMMRRTEVEVHHADLGIGYSAADWPSDFVAALMKRRRRELAEDGLPFSWRATDTGDTWSSGDGPTVEGTAADLAWWLLGRGSGERLTSSSGSLPEIGSWA